jgi:3-phenylpropionate/cinnamic acid dioxygenase small subunit
VAAEERHLGLSASELRLEVKNLYASYTACLDEERFEDWPGQYRDRPVVEEGRLKFREKLCIFDNLLIPNSLVYPL